MTTDMRWPGGYQLSQRGWIQVRYDQRTWIPCPLVFPEGEDRRSWSRLFAEEWWYRSGQQPVEQGIAALAWTLAQLHEQAYTALPMHEGFIHLPDLRQVPLVVGIGVWEAAGEAEEQLRALTHAGEAGQMRPPQVTQCHAKQLGTGLRVLAHLLQGEQIMGVLSYAWRSQEYATAIRIFTASPDLGRLQRVSEDIERLADAITMIERPQPRA